MSMDEINLFSGSDNQLAAIAHKETERLIEKLNAAETTRQSGVRGFTISESRAIIETIYSASNNKTP